MASLSVTRTSWVAGPRGMEFTEAIGPKLAVVARISDSNKLHRFAVPANALPRTLSELAPVAIDLPHLIS